ncbi:unnamed protein product [Plutella xylostella]|uniref:(diamondback moth) hypothetical protein n=1 Tax=Plutella xylostella TaxID=51655 RepID=A0A8S4G087_PLUXY|nr:unnamed protein product [Plutella xylostella]
MKLNFDCEISRPLVERLRRPPPNLQSAGSSLAADFLEEHARQLTDELRKKARLLRTLLSQAPAGALAGSEREQHKTRFPGARQLTDELRKKARLLRTLLSQAPAGALVGSDREQHKLTDELRKKARLLRTLLSQAPAGALAGSEREQHKKDIARLGGGAMAAVWGGDPAGMTLELSLEMNNRLQAVLEDALLKNITLKVSVVESSFICRGVGGDPAGMTLELSLEMNNRLQAVLEDALLKNITLKVSVVESSFICRGVGTRPA